MATAGGVVVFAGARPAAADLHGVLVDAGIGLLMTARAAARLSSWRRRTAPERGDEDPPFDLDLREITSSE